jgi:class 3 adenylate cyclase/tetratricopeptide (TPR) repeat protein
MVPEHASRLATDWLAADVPDPWRELEGTAVLVDLTGFTRLTEALAGLGPEGAEVMHRALTLCFSTLLAPSLAAGGDIIGFAGDAALVWFEGDGHALRAVESAIAMPAGLARLPAAVTGGKRLRATVGVHSGPMTAILAGSSQRGLFWCGHAVSTLAQLTAAAIPGKVLVSDAVAERLPVTWQRTPQGLGVEVTPRGRHSVAASHRATTSIVAEMPDLDAAATERCSSLLSPPVRELMANDGADATGDHRAAAVGFLAVPGVDALLATDGPEAVHASLHHVAATVSRVADELSVCWLDSDMGLDSVKLLITAGAPRAVDDDEGRLLLALRRMLDESDVVLRAGAQRGRVFCGPLGVQGRRTFTVIGDAVNVAARALGLAADRELIVGDGMGAMERSSVTAVPLGAQALKNRQRPMEMSRVVEVFERREHNDDAQSSVFVAGRAAEQEQIAMAWKQTVEGRGASLCVVGEAGMGASGLLADAVERAGAAGLLVVTDGYRQQVSYGGVATIVRLLAETAGATTVDDGWAWLVSFASLLDDGVRSWIDDGHRAFRRTPRLDEIDPVTTARRAQAVLASLVRAAAPTPWLLAVDDVDAIDDASRSVLRNLQTHAAGQGWLVVVSSEPGAASIDHLERTSRVITLEPLSAAASTAFVLDVEPKLRDDQVAGIVAAGKGNPFVLAELARHHESGDLPDSLERLATSRIDALPAPARRLVRAASTFGVSASLATIAEVLGRPELTDRQMWSDAAPVLRPGADDTVTFRHDAYRRAAYASLPFQQRRELHSAIADHLATQHGTSDAVLARHYQEAGRTREAFPLAINAGRAAMASGALVEASELLGRAVRMAREVDRPALGALLVEHGDILMSLGDLAGAERSFAAAGRSIRDPLGYASMCSHRAGLAIRRTQYRQARRWVQKGLTICEPLADAAIEVRGKLLLDEAAALHFMGRNDDGRRLATDALLASQRSANRYLEGLAHLHLEMIDSALLLPEASEHGDAAIRIFEAIGHERQLCVALSNSGLTAMHAGAWDDALDRYQRAAAVAVRSGDTNDAAVISMNEGFLLLRQGKTVEADAKAMRAMRTADAAGLELLGAYARHLRSGVATAEGRFADGEALMAEARAMFARLGDTGMVVDCDVAAIDALLRSGRPQEALSGARSVESHLVHADEAVVVMLCLSRGLAQARTGDVTSGVSEILGALGVARERRLPYEVYLCLVALMELDVAGGPPAPVGAGEERDDIARTLGLVDRPPDPLAPPPQVGATTPRSERTPRPPPQVGATTPRSERTPRPPPQVGA